MADLVITDADDFPDPVPEFSIIYCEVNLFSPSINLNGTAMIYCDGDFKIMSGNSSRFYGLIYVTGNIVLRDDLEIHGAVVAESGTVNLQGSSPNYASIYYDPDVLASLRTEMGQYRFAGAFRPVIIRE
jgi:hypothetical protein